MAPIKESWIFVPVFLDGTLPRYGFCRCVAWALGVVVPSAGLMGRGVAIEYPRGASVCPQAVTLNVTATAKLGIFKFTCVFTAFILWTLGCKRDRSVANFNKPFLKGPRLEAEIIWSQKASKIAERYYGSDRAVSEQGVL